MNTCFPDSIRTIPPHLGIAPHLPWLGSPEWTAYRKPAEDGRFTQIAINIEAMGKQLAIAPAVYQDLCEKGRWDLVLPDRPETFVEQWLVEINEQIEPKLKATRETIQKITRAWREISPAFSSTIEFHFLVEENIAFFHLQTGETFIQLAHHIQKGSSNAVWLGIDFYHGVPCACLRPKDEKKFEDHFKKSTLFPEFQPTLYGSFFAAPIYALFQELFSCNFGDAFTEERIVGGPAQVPMARQLLEICSIIHEKGTHRDIKPDNILLRFRENKLLKTLLSDYEFFTLHEDEDAKYKLCYTPDYIAPEYAKSQLEEWESLSTLRPPIHPPASFVQPTYDIFSLGLVLSLALLPIQECPLWLFKDWRPDILILKEMASYATTHWMPKEPENKTSFQYLIWRMTHFDPKQRPSAQECLSILSKIIEAKTGA